MSSMSPFIGQSPEQALLKLGLEAVATESSRLGLKRHDPQDTLTTSAPFPGTFAYMRPYGGYTYASLESALEVLQKLPDRAGPDAAFEALETARQEGKLRRAPSNSQFLLQIGDLVRCDGLVFPVQKIRVGMDRDSAKTGNDVDCIAWSDVRAKPEAMIIISENAWLRGTQFRSLEPATSVEVAKREHLRHLHTQTKKAVYRARYAISGRWGAPLEIVRYLCASQRLTAIQAMLTEDYVNRQQPDAAAPEQPDAATPEKTERRLVRERIREINADLRRMGHCIYRDSGFAESMQLDKALRAEWGDLKEHLAKLDETIRLQKGRGPKPGI